MRSFIDYYRMPQLFPFITNRNCELSVCLNLRPHFMFSLCFLCKGILVISPPPSLPPTPLPPPPLPQRAAVALFGFKVTTLLLTLEVLSPARLYDVFIFRVNGVCHESCWCAYSSFSLAPSPCAAGVVSASQLFL